ncbi:NAD-dependent epimerase/dehydratase family protein [Sphingomonas psychrolutea]|uniref:Epimerase n=1 Tax=Sphingomonas psychrolutea TaxID=1259676 RepID=A0ABQ1G469_9SPHN|nr:NAD-dependent epimerase/dehydratase family protein [Sphingomonas psychrolutea]GGA37193.1 epimerase [Sphingomonas psychrolutea]
MNEDSPALVTGASGFVGSHIARLLTARGRKVRVLLRKTSSQAALRGLPVEIVYGDVLDRASMRAAMQGCATVFHSVVDPRFWLTDQSPIYRNNVDGLVNAMDAALACGIERFVFTSTMGTLGLNPDGPVTEDIPFNWLDRAPPYIRARLEAENRFFEYCRVKGLPGVALCVANTYGPQDYQPTPHNGQLWQIAQGKAKIALDVAQPTVDIRDVAQAALAAEICGRTGERYIIANEFIGARAFHALAIAGRGQVPPVLISYRTAYAIAWGVEQAMKLLQRKDYVVSRDAVYLSNVFGEMDNGKARRELGWQPRPVSETVRDAVNWFAAREREAR